MLTVGLLWLRHLSHPHGNINTQNIYIENDELSLSDPWIAPLCHASEEQYPAPEKILAIENRI